MISKQDMLLLSAEAQDRFPLPDDVAIVLAMTGNREVTVPITEERVLWMLNWAYSKGFSEASLRKDSDASTK